VGAREREREREREMANDVARGLHTLHGFFNPMDDGEILVGFIRSGPWKTVTPPINTNEHLERCIRHTTGAQSFAVDGWLGRTYFTLKQEDRNLIPDVIMYLNHCGINVNLQTKLAVTYHAGNKPQRLSPDVSELKFLCRTYAEILRSLVHRGGKKAKEALWNEILNRSDQEPCFYDENFYKSEEGKQFVHDMSEYRRRDSVPKAKEMWFPSLAASIRREDASFNAELDYPPPTLAYEETSLFVRRFEAYKKEQRDEQAERSEEKEKKKKKKKRERESDENGTVERSVKKQKTLP
jgi:hypothetical protein